MNSWLEVCAQQVSYLVGGSLTGDHLFDPVGHHGSAAEGVWPELTRGSTCQDSGRAVGGVGLKFA